ncbi:MAG: DEAD/DEAH box helicase, partial [Candidatus Atribacteria bacterium]|nr:DEAD/DEAH box helicase [Candidatus Atribacteria bacterium]
MWLALAREIEARYRRYLETTFRFRDADLRQSFEEALRSERLSKGPYLEATPVFARGQTPRSLFREVLGFAPDEGFLRALQEDRPLYKHQEGAVRAVHEQRNVIVATGTGSGKTEAFLYPILLHLYAEYRAQGTLGPGVRALILYPMNALANDQRERLGEICKRLQNEGSPFQFTFGQYTGK